MKIKVTEKDIKYGEERCPGTCPIARAINRELPGQDVMVFKSICEINHYEYELPPRAYDFIEQFDAGLPVEPFEFDISGLEKEHYQNA